MDIKTLPKPLAIIGMGKSGEAAKRLLLSAGISSKDFFTFDQKQADADYSDPNVLMSEVNPRTLVVSPGVPLASKWIQEAIGSGVQLTSELSLAASFLTTEKLIGVTGSVGKSTTVSILGAGASVFAPDFFVGGNLGTPLASYAADVITNARKPAKWVILELSSYQLENCAGLQFDFSAITYFTANHMERYPALSDYYGTKWKLLSLTKNQMILNSHGGDLSSYAAQHPSPNIIFADPLDPSLERFHLSSAKLIGKHNQDNLAVAARVALAAGWPEESIQKMKAFRGLEHRLEYVDEIRGVRFINDSKATAIDSVLIAVEAAASDMNKNGRLFVLLGGRDKNLPWEKLAAFKSLLNAHFFFFGECRKIAQDKSALAGLSFAHLHEALSVCFSDLKAGDTLLLSPGGTSLDEFKNFEARGDFFKQQILLFAKA